MKLSNEVELLYRVSVREDFGHIEIAIYDPERWRKSNPDDPDKWGGSKFGFEAQVSIDEEHITDWENYDRSAQRKIVAQVSQAAIGSHSVQDAEQRIFVYTQALRIAQWINERLDGMKLEDIGLELEVILVAGQPTQTHLSDEGPWKGYFS